MEPIIRCEAIYWMSCHTGITMKVNPCEDCSSYEKRPNYLSKWTEIQLQDLPSHMRTDYDDRLTESRRDGP